jgi:hypothetical protein
MVKDSKIRPWLSILLVVVLVVGLIFSYWYFMGKDKNFKLLSKFSQQNKTTNLPSADSTQPSTLPSQSETNSSPEVLPPTGLSISTNGISANGSEGFIDSAIKDGLKTFAGPLTMTVLEPTGTTYCPGTRVKFDYPSSAKLHYYMNNANIYTGLDFRIPKSKTLFQISYLTYSLDNVCGAFKGDDSIKSYIGDRTNNFASAIKNDPSFKGPTESIINGNNVAIWQYSKISPITNDEKEIVSTSYNKTKIIVVINKNKGRGVSLNLSCSSNSNNANGVPENCEIDNEAEQISNTILNSLVFE